MTKFQSVSVFMGHGLLDVLLRKYCKCRSDPIEVNRFVRKAVERIVDGLMHWGPACFDN